MKENSEPTSKKPLEPYTPVIPPIPSKPADWAVDKMAFPCYCQPKMNGVKALLSPDGRIYLKSAEHRPHLEQFGACGHWLDCELWHPNMDLGTIAGLVNRRIPDQETARLQLWAVDLIHPELQQYERFAVLETIIRPLTNVYLIETWYCEHGLDSAERYKYTQTEAAYDGMIYRDFKAKYTFGKTSNVLKRKKELDAEYLCVGVTAGMGKFFGMLGSFQLKDANGNEFSCGGGDLTVEDRRSFWKQPPIGKYIQVRFPYYSNKNIPQCPQFVRVRENLAV